MTCQQVQINLSLYLYGELDFSQEEELERHLSECALCQRALAREKTWHTVLNAERADVPLDLLSKCRQELRAAISPTAVKRKSGASSWWHSLGFSGTHWSMRIATASFLIFAGFGAARWMDRNGLPGHQIGGIAEMGLLNPATTRIRDIQPGDNHRVRIIVDQVHEGEITGRVDDDNVRQLLLAATKDADDPGIRLDSVEMLKGQNDSGVREALLYSLRHDSNAAVRLKALDGLRQFAGDPATRQTLRFVLERDDNAGVRSEAINVLVPLNERVAFSPDLADTLRDVIRSERNDDYVRMRCLQVLRDMNVSLNVY